jgi:hypothetical protein
MLAASMPPTETERAVECFSRVMSARECRRAVAAAEAHAAASGGWGTARHAAYPTVDIAAADIWPGTGYGWLGAVLAARLLRPMETRYRLPAASLVIRDLFVAKYQPKGQPGLGPHEDDSAWSFVVALNQGDRLEAGAGEWRVDGVAGVAAEFAGGGTRFELVGAPENRPVFRPPAGCAIGFNGKNRHCGLPVRSGTRYILAGFLSVVGGGN